jgi:hypothetical protein
MNQHFEFQIALAGGKSGGGSQGNQAIYQNVGPTPDDIPDIGSMVPIGRSD